MYHKPADYTERFVDRLLNCRRNGDTFETSYRPLHSDKITASGHTQPGPEALTKFKSAVDTLDLLQPVNTLEIGVLLGRYLLPEEVMSQICRDIEDAQHSAQRLRLWIDDEFAAGMDWPWEFLWLAGIGFLSVHPHCGIIRSFWQDSETPTRDVALLDTHLEILTIWVLPEAKPQVDTMRNTFASLGPHRIVHHILGPRGVVANDHSNATRSNLLRELNSRRIHVLIIVAHGHYNLKLRQGVLQLEPEEGDDGQVHASQLREYLRKSPSTALVLLDSCDVFRHGGDDNGMSIARALTTEGCVVVGHQAKFRGELCLTFWGTFVDALVRPLLLDDCLHHSREVLFYLENPDLAALRGLSNQHFQPGFSPQYPDYQERVAERRGQWALPAIGRPRKPDGETWKRPAASTSTDQLHSFDNSRAVQELDSLSQWGELSPELFRKIEILRLLTPQQFELVRRLWQAPKAERQELLDELLDSDPTRLILLGSQDQPIFTRPLWYTQLLEPPARLAWSSGPGPWDLRIRDFTASKTLFELHVGEVSARESIPSPAGRPPMISISLPDNIRTTFPRGCEIHWVITQSGATEVPRILNAFQVLPKEHASLLSLALDQIQNLPPGPEQIVRMAHICLETKLYDELEEFLLTQLVQAGPAQRLLVCRSLTRLYQSVHQMLNGELSLPGPGSAWAAGLADKFMRDGFMPWRT